MNVDLIIRETTQHNAVKNVQKWQLSCNCKHATAPTLFNLAGSTPTQRPRALCEAGPSAHALASALTRHCKHDCVKNTTVPCVCSQTAALQFGGQSKPIWLKSPQAVMKSPQAVMNPTPCTSLRCFPSCVPHEGLMARARVAASRRCTAWRHITLQR